MTTFDIKLDDTHDIFLDGQDLAVAEEQDIVVQRLRIRLQFLFQEWFLDATVGIPYTQTIFEQGTSIDDVYSIFQSEVSDTEGVENIIELNLTPDAENKGMRVETSVNENVSVTVEVSA